MLDQKSPTKIAAVKEVFLQDNVTANDTPSLVSDQPFSDSETRQGAINRASGSLETALPGTVGIGLEGGAMYVGNELYLCNWGALVTADSHTFTASGARILLPEEIKDALIAGEELGDVMDRYAQRENVRKNEGAIGIFTNKHVSRKMMFTHVVKLLYGQWEYWTRG